METTEIKSQIFSNGFDSKIAIVKCYEAECSYPAHPERGTWVEKRTDTVLVLEKYFNSNEEAEKFLKTKEFNRFLKATEKMISIMK